MRWSGGMAEIRVPNGTSRLPEGSQIFAEGLERVVRGGRAKRSRPRLCVA